MKYARVRLVTGDVMRHEAREDCYLEASLHQGALSVYEYEGDPYAPTNERREHPATLLALYAAGHWCHVSTDRPKE